MTGNYEEEYIDLPFEGELRKYRKQNVLQLMKRYQHRRILEIGCGPEPLFRDVAEFDQMVIAEPGKLFYGIARSYSKDVPSVKIYNDRIENLADQLKPFNFDFIVIGGFLHEIDSPEAVLSAVYQIASPETCIYSFVPNANSFHRLLAVKMGLIENVYIKSGYDKLFQRKEVYNSDSYQALFTTNGYRVIESGSYFIKPFSHSQMNAMLDNGIIDNKCLDGLNHMIEYMPDLGAELWNLSQII